MSPAVQMASVGRTKVLRYIDSKNAVAASFQPQQREKVAEFFDDGIGFDHS